MAIWVIFCLALGIVINDEVFGWICLVLAALPPFLEFCYAYAKVIERETRRSYSAEEYGIDDEGFYY